MSFNDKHFLNPSVQGTVRPLFLSAADFGWLEPGLKNGEEFCMQDVYGCRKGVS